MKKIYVLIVLVLFVFIVYSCKKTQKDTGTIYKPVAYTLQYPDFVTQFIGVPKISPDNPLTVQGIALGRRLFYDKKLSGDESLNCASCHQQQHAFNDSVSFSKGVNGQPGTRNAMSIMNLAWSDRFFWDGRRSSLEGQAHDPVVNPIEMAGTWPVVMKRLQQDVNYPELFFQAFGTKIIDSDLVTKAIAQFERTLTSYNSGFDQYFYLKTKTFTFQQANGYTLFQKEHCIDCHTVGLFTDHAFRNNGMDLVPADSGLAKFTHNAADYGKFKVPSLRNVALTAPYMHDGRFETLEQVIGFYFGGVLAGSPNVDSNMKHVINAPRLSLQQQADLVAFLKTLTDSSYIANAVYSDL